MLTAAVPLLYRWLALACLLIASMLFGAMEMHMHDAKAYDKLMLKVQTAGDKQNAQTAAVIVKQKEISNDTITAYQDAINGLRTYYAGRVRPSAGCRQVSAIPATAQSTHDAPANRLPLAGIIATLVPPQTPSTDLTEQCAETTLQLVTLQSWINKQSQVK